MTKPEWVVAAKTRIAMCDHIIKWADNHSSCETNWSLVQLEGQEAEQLKSFLEEGVRLMEV